MNENIEKEKETLEEAIGEVSPVSDETVSETPAEVVTLEESSEDKSGEQESEKQE